MMDMEADGRPILRARSHLRAEAFGHTLAPLSPLSLFGVFARRGGDQIAAIITQSLN